MKNKITACFLTFILMFLFGASNVYAHANLLTTTPHNGEVVKAAPDKISLDFGEDLEPNLIDLKVYDWNARQINTNGPYITPGKPYEMYAKLPHDLQEGSYTVAWNVVSQDGHPVSGSYVFSIGHVIVGSTIEPNSTQGIMQSLLIVFRYIVEGLILVSAGLYWIAKMGRRRGYPDLKQLFTYTRLIWLILIVGTCAEWITYSSSLPGGGLTEELLSGHWQLIVQSRFATILIVQIFLLILLALPQMIDTWYMGMWALLVIVLAFAGHAWGIQPIWAAIVVRSLHVLSIAVWIGALTYLGLLLWQQAKGRIEWDRKHFRTFFVWIVAIASGVVVVTGVVMTGMQTGLMVLIQNPVTWTVLLYLKVVLFLVMICIAVVQTTRWKQDGVTISPLLLRLEWMVGIVVVLFGVWISQIAYPLPAKSYSQTLQSNHIQADVSISKLSIGTQTIKIHFLDQAKSPQNVNVQVNMQDMDMEFTPIPAHRIGIGTYQADIPFTMSGEWKFVVDAEYQLGDHKQWKDTVFIPGGGS